VNEVKKENLGFVDVPVGDYKISQLDKHPNLCQPHAPRLRFTQTEGQDLCVSKALASTLYHLGFEESAFKIDEFGLNSLSGGTLNSLELVKDIARKSLPRWIALKRIPKNLQWKDLPKNQILLAVLLGSDGSNSHCICIHGEWIFDANETVAIPFCQEGLNYCASNAERPCAFIRFWKGFIFFYEGKQVSKIEQMRGGP